MLNAILTEFRVNLTDIRKTFVGNTLMLLFNFEQVLEAYLGPCQIFRVELFL